MVSNGDYERVVFEAFLDAHPSVASRVRETKYPKDERDRVDVFTRLDDGSSKSQHYGGIGTADFRLIVFYNRAHHYNTPFVSVDVRSLGDLAKIANHTLSETTVPFTCVYLLDVPTREAFEVYPEVKPCE